MPLQIFTPLRLAAPRKYAPNHVLPVVYLSDRVILMLRGHVPLRVLASLGVRNAGVTENTPIVLHSSMRPIFGGLVTRF